MRPALPLVACLLAAPAVFAAEPTRQAGGQPAAKRQAKAAMALPSLGLGGPTGIPKGEELSSGRTAQADSGPQVKSVDERFEVLTVQHAQGAPPRAALAQVAVSGAPLRTEPFSTKVRVRSAARRTAPIEVVVLDVRGDTVMSATGSLNYSGLQGEVAEYSVDWDSSPVRGPGTYSVLVRVAGQPLGTWPLPVVAR